MAGQAGQARGKHRGRRNVDGFMALTCAYSLRGKRGRRNSPIEAGRVSSSGKSGPERLSLWRPSDLRPRWRMCLPRLPQTGLTGHLTCENGGAGATCPAPAPYADSDRPQAPPAEEAPPPCRRRPMTLSPLAIKPIETRYAGCRFRSRLEARWAVFFDRVGIKWEYEPQGYVVDGKPYLPDFWLPDLNVWAEVKGVLGSEELCSLVRATRRAGLPACPAAVNLEAPPVGYEPRILILGAIPRTERAWLHARLDLVGDRVFVSFCLFASRTLPTRPSYWAVSMVGEPFDVSERLAFSPAVLELVTGGKAFPLARYEGVIGAYAAARSARFEHGESP